MVHYFIQEHFSFVYKDKDKQRFVLKIILLVYQKQLQYRNFITMCISPCQTCSAQNFYSCLSCTNTSQVLTGSLCVGTPTFYFQIITTCLAFGLIIPVLIRKRCITLVKIVDYIQLAAYFKLILGYTSNRHIWLYLGMRSWTPWTQGWSIISEDYTTPIWTVEQGVINKSIRITATWGVFAIIAIIMGALKVALDERQMTFEKFMRKNIGNFFSYAYYFTLQDIAFVIAVPLLNLNFSTTSSIISIGLSVFFCLFTILVILWSFCVVNFQDNQQKYYHYKYLFLFSMDYDIFPTYQLLDLPKTVNQIKRYGNLRIIDMIKKIVYAFLIVSYLSSSKYASSTANDELFQILAFLSFFQIVWLVIMPYNIKKQFIQFVLGILAFGITLYLLFAPWYISQQIVNTALVLSLFGLALISILIELCFNMYKIVPVDLYGTGLKVVIEDHRLLKQIAMRKKQQEQIQKRLRQMQEQNQRLRKQMQQKSRNIESEKKLQNNKQKTRQNIRQDSQSSLAAHNQVLKTKTQLNQAQTMNQIRKNKNQLVSNNEQFEERASMNSQDIAQLYKVDELKRRQVYQWNKQLPFSYSNKME